MNGEDVKNRFQKLREHQAELRREVAEKTAGFILSALGLVAALAWNEAIKSIISIFFPNPGKSVVPEIIYAVIVTVIVVIVSFYLARLMQKKEPAQQ